MFQTQGGCIIPALGIIDIYQLKEKIRYGK